jgi:hypothetical protein
MFPYIETISWILRHVDLEIRYILNDKIHLITSFEASIINSCYLLEDGDKSLDEKLIKKFLHNPKELLKARYKPEKVFKSRPLGDYLTNFLKKPYQYTMAMLCRL